jgi:putative sugar O-methyltransferase
MHFSMRELRELYADLAADKDIQDFYNRYPRNTWWARENRDCSAELIQRFGTTEELVHEMQRTYLFSINSEHENRRLAVDWMIAKYREQGLDIGTLPKEVEESPVSYDGNSVDHAGRRLSVDFFRTLAATWKIQQLIQKKNEPLRVVELGAGLGHLARILRIMKVARSQVILDLPETLIFSYAFLTLNFPGAKALFITSEGQAKSAVIDDYDFVFVPSCFAHSVNLAGAELFVNTASLGEMQNESIRYWMRFVQEDLSVKHIFVQNRFLNVIDPEQYAWRWNENEGSVRFDRSWTILGWDLEPTWFRCPYVVSISSRQLEIAATRDEPPSAESAERRSQALIAEVEGQDWLQRSAEPPYMNMRQNPFVTDVTMTGTLFKLWEAIRLHATDEAVYLMLRYLGTVGRDPKTVFEEARYYEDLLLALVTEQSTPDILSYAEELRTRRTAEPECRMGVELVAATRDYNVVAVELARSDWKGGPKKIYLALSKDMGPVDPLGERIGARDLPPLVLRADSVEVAMARARALERPDVELVDSFRSYNIVRSSRGYVAVAQSLGPTSLFSEWIGERDLAPVVLTAPTYEALCEKIGGREQVAAERMDVLEAQLQTRASQADLAAQAAAERMDALEAQFQTRASQADLAAQAAAERMEALEAQFQTRASQADLAAQAAAERMEALEAQFQTRVSQADLAAQAAESRLDALEAQLRAQTVAESETGAAQQSHVDQIRDMLQGLRSDLEAISRQQQLIARQVSLLQDGPGDPGRPFVAGEHRGFSLIHYQGRVYALRKGFEPSEAQMAELLALNGSSDVIAGHSLDGARARIDVLEDARELFAEQAALHQELVAVEFRLTEALRQVDTTLQTNAQALERMAHMWPNRLFVRFSK